MSLQGDMDETLEEAGRDRLYGRPRAALVAC